MNAVVFEAEKIRKTSRGIFKWQTKESCLGNGNALRAIGESKPVHQDEADHFTEGQGNDGQIVAAQTQYRKAEDNAPCGGKQPREWQRDIKGPRHDAIAKP